MIGSWLQQGGLDTRQWWFCSAFVWPNSIQCPCLPGSSLVFQFELCAGFWRLPCPVHRSVRNAAFTSQMVLDDECWMATTWHFSPKFPGASPFLSKCKGVYQSSLFLPLDCMLMLFYRFSSFVRDARVPFPVFCPSNRQQRVHECRPFVVVEWLGVWPGSLAGTNTSKDNSP